MSTKDKRFNLLRQILQQRKFFKLVCGAGNEDVQEIRRLALIFTAAGATMFDLSANIEVVDAALEGRKLACDFASRLGKDILIEPFLNVSIGIKGDPHVRKAVIKTDACTHCGECTVTCKQEAIDLDYVVKEYRCIGCGNCTAVCKFAAIQFVHKRSDLSAILPACVEKGVETMELHAVTDDDEAVFNDWQMLNRIIPDNYISMCLDRSLLSNMHLVERINTAYKICGERMIVQADGVPMSGEKDDFNSTLQAIACADVVQKSGIPVIVILSGGTNSKTGLLARQCGVNAHGIAVGSFARMLVRDYIRRDDFEENVTLIKEAVSLAEALIKSNIKELSG